MIQTLSKQAEDRIMQALEKLAEDETCDDAPNTAIAKIAGQLGIPAGHINLVVRAYNNTRASWQRENGETLAEKAATFPLADVPGVLKLAYPDAPDTAQSRERRDGISNEYSRGPDWYDDDNKSARHSELLQILSRPVVDKQAAEVVVDRDTRFKLAYKRAIAIQQRLEHVRGDLAVAREQAFRALQKLAAQFDALGAPSFADVKATAEFKHGAAGTAVMNQLARMRPGLHKQASFDPYYRVSQFPAINTGLQDAVTTGLALVSAMTKFEAQCKRAAEHIAAELNPFLDKDDPDDDMELSAEDELLGKAAGIPKQVGVALTVTKLRDMIDQMTGSYPQPNVEGRIQKQLGKLNDPTHEAQMRDMETQFALQDMLMNDPIISSHDPNTVATAMNEISRTVPHYARQPLLVRPLLRRALELGNLDSFDAGEAVGTEHKLHSLQPSMLPQPPQPQKPGGPVNAARRSSEVL